MGGKKFPRIYGSGSTGDSSAGHYVTFKDHRPAGLGKAGRHGICGPVRGEQAGAKGGEGENRGYHHKCGGYKGRVQAGDAPFIAAQAFQALKGYVQ